jgi:membrane-associated phospholipid phosphatase
LNRFFVLVVTLLLASSWSWTARAADEEGSDKVRPGFVRGGGKPLRWDPAWREFDWFDAGLMGVATAGIITGTIIGPDTSAPNRGGVLFDDDVRDALRLRNSGDRQFARDTSDFFLSTVIAYPYFVDSLLVASWYRQSPRIGMQMALIAAEAAVVTYSLQTAANVISSRERPFGRECGDEVDPESDDCVADNRFKSFLSGHTSQSFAAAGVTCVFHAKMPLYGGNTDWIPCASSLTLAAATGTLRVVSDQHYATDVVSGALLGAGVGVGLPLLLHFHGSTPERTAESKLRVFVVPTTSGVQAVGVF